MYDFTIEELENISVLVAVYNVKYKNEFKAFYNKIEGIIKQRKEAENASNKGQPDS
jgi:hypothetical protein